jgi:hypothetical protein
MPKNGIIFHTQCTKRSQRWSKYRAHVIGSHCIRSITCLGSNLLKGMLNLNFLLFKSYKHFNKGSHLLSTLVNATKNVEGFNCQIIAKTFFLDQLRYLCEICICKISIYPKSECKITSKFSLFMTSCA